MITREFLEKRFADLKQEAERSLIHYHQVTGHMQEVQMIMMENQKQEIELQNGVALDSNESEG